MRAATEWAASLIPDGLLGHLPLSPKGISTCDARGGLESSRAWGLRSQPRTQERGHVPDPDPAVPPAEGRAQPSPLGAEELCT